MSGPSPLPVYRCGVWELDTARRELRSGGILVPLSDRAFDLLEILVQSAGQLVGKSDLMSRIWPGLFVEENTLHVYISAVRKALGADREMLKTSSGRGYWLAGTWASHPDRASGLGDTAVASVSGRANPTNFPAAALALVGRSVALQDLHALLSTQRVVTLTGPGGIGKTSLALEVGRTLVPGFPGGGWLIELASLSHPDLLPSSVARTLGLKLIGGELSPVTIARSIGSNKLLLLLDGCEHLINAVAALAEILIRLCPNLSVMSTSRELLRIAGERVYRVPPLDVPPERLLGSKALLEHSAVQLFIARRQAWDGHFSPAQEDLETAATICRRLDGMPLAIEFAAARATMLGSELVLSHLDERFALLAGGHRAAQPRHQTLRATLDWSFDLLSEQERRLLRRLSAFASAFTLEGATALMSDTGAGTSAVMYGIADLIAKSLVTVDRSSPTGRWRLLETIRAYAREKLREAGEAETVARLHAQFFRDLIAAAASSSLSHFSTEQLERYRHEIDNVRAALDWAFSGSGDTEIGIALAAAYAPIWLNLALPIECRERTEQALRSLKPDSNVSAPLLMQLNLEHAVALMFTMGSVDRIRADLAEALEIAERLDDVNGQLRVLWSAWAVHFTAGDCYAMREAAERFSRAAARSHDATARLFSDRLVGAGLLMSGDPAAAQHRLTRVIESYVTPLRHKHTFWEQFDQAILARALLARALCLRGFADQAVSHAQKSLDDARSLDSKYSQCEVLRLAVCPVALMTGDLSGATLAVAAYLQLAASINSDNQKVWGKCLEGEFLILNGEFSEGVSILRPALEALVPAGWTTCFPEFLGALSQGLAGLGQRDEAFATLEQALARAERSGERWHVPELLRAKGELLLQAKHGDSIEAAEVSFRRGLEVAREQGALLWELRNGVSLARLWRESGRSGDAKTLLAPICARFSEGFGTPDFLSAKSLLESP